MGDFVDTGVEDRNRWGNRPPIRCYEHDTFAAGGNSPHIGKDYHGIGVQACAQATDYSSLCFSESCLEIREFNLRRPDIPADQIRWCNRNRPCQSSCSTGPGGPPERGEEGPDVRARIANRAPMFDEETSESRKRSLPFVAAF